MSSGEFDDFFPVAPEEQPAINQDVIDRALALRRKLRRVNLRHIELMHEYELPTSEQFVIGSAANDIVPVPHDRYLLQPKHRKPIIEGVRQLRVRIPSIEASDPGGNVEPIELNAADIFFEFVGSRPTPARYLLNLAGFMPYSSSADVVPNTDLFTPGMFTVPEARVAPEDYGMLELARQLLRQYRPKQDDNCPLDAA